MNDWSNIEVAADDPEITEIDNLGKNLGELPENIRMIRELITRFEVCHFKYQRHLDKILEAINQMNTTIELPKIGLNHIHQGQEACEKDSTGKSRTGLKYVNAINEWLNGIHVKEMTEPSDKNTRERIKQWLGNKNPHKTRLVKLLLARLNWDWKAYDELRGGGAFNDLEIQICRIDICHYAFPQNLEKVLMAIGKLKAVNEKEFEGCGSFTKPMQEYIQNKFPELETKIRSIIKGTKISDDDRVRVWLIACLMKTMKESAKLKNPVSLSGLK